MHLSSFRWFLTPKPGNNEKTCDMYAAIGLIFFIVYFFIGFAVFDDYGMLVDDKMQRRHSLVNYKYVNEVLFNREIPQLKEVPDLETYQHKYGVALQLPMVLYEDIHDFSLSTQEIYRMRHLSCFLICFVGYILFFFTLRKLFSKYSIVPILGTMFVALYPRFFSVQFTDIKNMVFAAVSMVSFFFMVMAVEEKRGIWQVLAGCSFALAVNVRMMAIIFPVILLGYYMLSDIYDYNNNSNSEKISIWEYIKKYCLVLGTFFLFWYLITPMAWKQPVSNFFDTFNTFSSYGKWKGTMVFAGKLITCEQMPWYYLFVWFALTIPVYLLVLFGIGHFCVIRNLFKEVYEESEEPVSFFQILIEGILDKYKWFFCAAAVFWGSVIGIIVLHCRIYIGWHHMYYVFVPFCIIACFGLDWMLKAVRFRCAVVLSLTALLLFQCGWMVYYHPFQSSYFNLIGKPVASEFDREEWRLSSLYVLEWLLDNTEGDITINIESSIYLNLLSDEEKSRITMVDDKSDYIVSFYRNVIGNDLTYDGYNEIFTVWVDGYKVASVFGAENGNAVD